MQHGAHKCLLQLLAKMYPNIKIDCMFKTDKLESTLCNDCGHSAINDGVCIKDLKKRTMKEERKA